MDEAFNLTSTTEDFVDSSYLLHLSFQFPLRNGFPEVFGYVLPPVIIFTAFTNCLVITILLKKEMRTPTNALLAGLAFSDMMCGIALVTVFFNFFTLRKFEKAVPFNWCLPYKLLFEIGTAFHNISVLQTVALATQRYIFICAPNRRSKFNFCSSIKVVILLVTIGILAQTCRFLDTFYVPALSEGSNTPGCIMMFHDWVKSNVELYIKIYYLSRATCFGLLPCMALTILTALLIKSMTSQRVKRRRMFRGRLDSLNHQDKQNVRTTLLLVVVVAIHLTSEIPNSVVMFVDAIEIAINCYSDSNAKLIVINLANIMVILSCPVNIFIYCGMSKKFRVTLKQMLKCN